MDLGVVLHHKLEFTLELISFTGFSGNPHLLVDFNELSDILVAGLVIRLDFVVFTVSFSLFDLSHEVLDVLEDLTEVW